MSLAVAADLPAAETSRGSDVSQAEVMLAFLERAEKGSVDDELTDRLLASAGTDLVIAQMNLMRRVSKRQYAEVLRGLSRAEPPVIEPIDGSGRAARGVTGLTENIWPLLRWGMSHTEVLRLRLDEIRSLDVYEKASRRAREYLPVPTEISADVSIVMGGRAGAAALAGGQIYVDLLMLSYLDDIGSRPYMPETDLTDFIAHEMHHLGLAKILAAHRQSLHLGEGGSLAYSVLSMLISEGSATYLVSGHRDLGRSLKGTGSSTGIVDRGDGLLKKSEAVLRALVGGEIRSREEYELATEFLLGSGAHTAGTLMLSRIDRHAGLNAVMAVLADPRRLLAAYNAAAAAATGADEPHLFDAELARNISGLGKPGGVVPNPR